MTGHLRGAGDKSEMNIAVAERVAGVPSNDYYRGHGYY